MLPVLVELGQLELHHAAVATRAGRRRELLSISSADHEASCVPGSSLSIDFSDIFRRKTEGSKPTAAVRSRYMGDTMIASQRVTGNRSSKDMGETSSGRVSTLRHAL